MQKTVQHIESVRLVKMSWNSVLFNISDYPNMAGLSHIWVIRKVQLKVSRTF